MASRKNKTIGTSLNGFIMEKYICLLKGINVSGKNMIKMNNLSNLFSNTLQFEQVKTYIQSGNIVFVAPKTTSAFLEKKIENAISANFKINVSVMIRNESEWENDLKQIEFFTNKEDSKKYFIFLKSKPNKNLFKKIENQKYVETYLYHNQMIYLYCPNQYGNAKLTNQVFEKTLNMPVTARNFNTVKKIQSLLNELQT